MTDQELDALEDKWGNTLLFGHQLEVLQLIAEVRRLKRLVPPPTVRELPRQELVLS